MNIHILKPITQKVREIDMNAVRDPIGTRLRKIERKLITRIANRESKPMRSRLYRVQVALAKC